jgi:hypothetical protein
MSDPDDIPLAYVDWAKKEIEPEGSNINAVLQGTLQRMDEQLGRSLQTLKRWTLLRTPWFGIHLQRILHGNHKQTPQNYPWNYRMLFLKGCCKERLYRVYLDVTGGFPGTKKHLPPVASEFVAGDFVRREGFDENNFEVINGPIWMLIFSGKKWEK